MAMTGEGAGGKPRYAAPGFARRYPLTIVNTTLARPLSYTLAAVGMTPNQVTVLSLVTSLAGVTLVATGRFPALVLGAGLVYLGALLDHADGQVARRTGRTSLWGMYLDSVVDRIVDGTLFLSILVAALRGGGALQRHGWTLVPLADETLAIMAAVALAGVAFGKFVSIYNTALYLREHVLAGGGRLEATPRAWTSTKARRWLPGYNRDVFLAMWCVGVISFQVPLMLVAVGGMGMLKGLVGTMAFRRGHRDIAKGARSAFDPDFH